MLTGDHRITALAVAKKLGLDDRESDRQCPEAAKHAPLTRNPGSHSHSFPKSR